LRHVAGVLGIRRLEGIDTQRELGVELEVILRPLLRPKGQYHGGGVGFQLAAAVVGCDDSVGLAVERGLPLRQLLREREMVSHPLQGATPPTLKWVSHPL